ncbi:hypothetical protein ACFL4H_00260 [Candidatus Neomarinimicrobiota bacterium]
MSGYRKVEGACYYCGDTSEQDCDDAYSDDNGDWIDVMHCLKCDKKYHQVRYLTFDYNKPIEED